MHEEDQWSDSFLSDQEIAEERYKLSQRGLPRRTPREPSGVRAAHDEDVWRRQVIGMLERLGSEIHQIKAHLMPAPAPPPSERTTLVPEARIDPENVIEDLCEAIDRWQEQNGGTAVTALAVADDRLRAAAFEMAFATLHPHQVAGPWPPDVLKCDMSDCAPFPWPLVPGPAGRLERAPRVTVLPPTLEAMRSRAELPDPPPPPPPPPPAALSPSQVSDGTRTYVERTGEEP